MPGKRTRPRSTRGQTSSTTTPIRLIVRRGARKRFESLSKKAKELNVVVEWDRRVGDRRTATDDRSLIAGERRRTERRQDPPFTWDSADFVVVIDRGRESPGDS
jgi:hypothetical protein